MKLLVLLLLITCPAIIWSQNTTEKDSVYSDVESSTCSDGIGFPGGTKALHKYLKRELTFNESPGFDPESVSRIYVMFTISKEGEIKDVEVLNTKNNWAIWEIERIFQRMPEWTPSQRNGEPVETRARISLRLNWIGPVSGYIF